MPHFDDVLHLHIIEEAICFDDVPTCNRSGGAPWSSITQAVMASAEEQGDN